MYFSSYAGRAVNFNFIFKNLFLFIYPWLIGAAMPTDGKEKLVRCCVLVLDNGGDMWNVPGRMGLNSKSFYPVPHPVWNACMFVYNILHPWTGLNILRWK